MSAYNTRDCNICSDKNCADRPRLGKPVIFNCPKFKAKRKRHIKSVPEPEEVSEE